MKTVLVTAGDTRVSYCIAKTLSKHGYRVFVGSRTRRSMAAASRHIAGSMVYSSPFTDEENFINDLKHFITRHNVDILVPVLEETYAIAKNRKKLAGHVKFLLPEYDQILNVHDKGKLAGVLKSIGISGPATVELSELLAGGEKSACPDFPVILKPKQGGGGWGMRVFQRKEELLDFAREHVETPERCIVQELLAGELFGVCALYKDGRFIVGDTYKCARVYPLKVGQSTTRVSIEEGPALRDLRKLLDHLRWNGVCEADFIVDAQKGRHYLLDINPRFWGSLAHSIAAGVNYPDYYCRLADDDASFETGRARAGTRTQWLGGEIMRFLAEFKGARGKLGYLSESVRSRSLTHAYDDWDIKDPLPFFAWGLDSLSKKIFKRKKDSLPGIWE